MKKALRITAIILASLSVIALAAFSIYWHHNIHWYDKYKKALESAGAEEKQFTTPNGDIINYGEVTNDKPALLLIHGQMGIWEDYALIMPELRTCPHRDSCMSFRQILPVTALKILEGRQPVGGFLPCHRQNYA